jgi:branched-chain amino acid transport system substrate-binding protein
MGRKIGGLNSLPAIALAAVSCGGPSGGGAATTGAEVIIGAPLSLTGTQSKEGALTEQGYDMWLTWINSQGGINVKGTKHRVQIKYEDDQSKPDISAQLAQKLISEEKAQFLLGPYGSATTASDAVVAEKNSIPMVEGNGAAQSIFSKGYRYTFGVLSPANKYLTGVLEMAATLSPKPATLALLSADDKACASDYTPSVASTRTGG